MALIKCPECGGTVSSFADKCPHCGRPMDEVEAEANQASSGPAYEPVSSPVYETVSPKSETEEQKTEISLGGNFGKVIMILLSIVAIILLGVYRSHYGQFDQSFLDSGKAAIGFMMSLAGLYFLIQMFKTGENDSRQFYAFCCLVLGTFVEVVLLKYLDGKTISSGVERNFDYICIAYGCSLLMYSGTMRNWSRLFMMIAGVFWIVRYSYFMHNNQFMLYSVTSSAFTALGIVCGLALLGMLICWFWESSNQNNSSNVRLMAGVQALLIIAAIVVSIIFIGSLIHHAGLDFDYERAYSSSKLLLIFGILVGAGSLLSALFVKNEVLNNIIPIFFAAAMFLLLGVYLDNYAVTTRNPNAEVEYFNRIRDLYYTALFFLPIGIMMHYVADMTKGMSSKISIKLN